MSSSRSTASIEKTEEINSIPISSACFFSPDHWRA